MSARPETARPATAWVTTALAATVALGVYALVRTFERLALPEPNPAALVWSERSAIFWRMVIAVYAGGAAAFGAVALTRHVPEKAARTLVVALAVALALFAIQMVVWP